MTKHQSLTSPVYEKWLIADKTMERSICHILCAIADLSDSMIQATKENQSSSTDLSLGKYHIGGAITSVYNLQGILLKKANLYALYASLLLHDQPDYQAEFTSDEESFNAVKKAIRKLKDSIHGTQQHWSGNHLVLQRLCEYFPEKKRILGIEPPPVNPPAPPWIPERTKRSPRKRSN